jgi:hypothetical protein
MLGGISATTKYSLVPVLWASGAAVRSDHLCESQPNPPLEVSGPSSGPGEEKEPPKGKSALDLQTDSGRARKSQDPDSSISFDYDSVDLRPVRDVLARLTAIWGEVERFVLALLDGWSVVLHQLATQTEQRVTSGEWLDQVLRHLRNLDQRFSQLAAGLDQLQGELRSREGSPESSHPSSRGGLRESELDPLIVPIRPETRAGTHSQEVSSVPGASPRHSLPKKTATTDREPEIQSESSAREDQYPAFPSSPQKLEELLRHWVALAEQLDQILPSSPEET